MSKLFDMELFLTGVLIGSHATRQRHVRQAKIIQVAIAERWQRENPWTWQKKHVVWFLENRLSEHSQATQYYYVLTVRLLARRLEASWVFKLCWGSDPDNHDQLQSAGSSRCASKIARSQNPIFDTSITITRKALHQDTVCRLGIQRAK